MSKNSKKEQDKVNLTNTFKPGESGNTDGRPKKIVSAALDALRLEGEEVTAAMAQETMNVFLSLTKAKITAIANDDKQSIMFRIIARAMLKDKQFEVLNSLLDRSHGKAIQKTEVKSEVEIKANDLTKLTDEELRKFIELATKSIAAPSGDGEA